MVMATDTSASVDPATGRAERSTDLRVDRLVGVLSYALLLLTFGLALRQALQPLRDPDTWWHLRLGEEFRGGWSPRDPGSLSPFADRPWTATQWLPDVLASQLASWFGLPGVVWFAAAGMLLLAAAVFGSCRRVGGVLPAVLATAATMVGASLSLTPRPHLVSFLFLAITLHAWLGTARDLRPRWWLLALGWVWACSHGMWLLGPMVGLAVIGGLLLERRLPTGRLARLLAVPVGSVVAAALTPAGPGLVLVPFTTRGTSQQYISEWGSPSFQEIAPATTALMIGVVVVVWARRGGRVPWTHVVLLGFATAWTLLSYRTVALGAVITAPLLAAALESLRRDPHEAGTALRERLVVAGMLLACLAGAAAVVSTSTSVASPATDQFPVALDADLAALPEGTVVFNEYLVGGWLEWEHRNVVPVIDGMTHAYPDAWVGEHVRATRLEKGWQDVVEGTGAEYALLRTASPLALELASHLDWREVGRDPRAGYVLLEAP
ncbi:hypothetical protein K1X13_02925 [Nocardioides sp. WL0053]|uniref:Glycosyltransferase RgtA/B/C/D-like domain-containing protein n=1 Tax=Nocardioides jiangsuensis TaxID=2866161 RepID=A0ABS7RGY6_9ACTN|nr:hypothetical protein [Nocardioides jiangsuensis]MBY9073767.1 hypothetical protein [Nocardioides jiangsuensis]